MEGELLSAEGDSRRDDVERLRTHLKELRESARRAARTPKDERDKAIELRHSLRRPLPDLTRDNRTVTVLAEHLSLVESRVERLMGATEGRDAAAVEILLHRGDLSWLPLGIAEEPQAETLLGVSSEVEVTGPVVETLGESDGGAAAKVLADVAEDLRHTRRTRLKETAELLFRAERPRVEDLWRVHMQAKAEGQRELREQLRDRIAKLVRDQDVPDAAEGLSICAAEYEDASQELIAVQGEAPPSEAAERLDQGRRQMQWLRVLLRDTLRRADRKNEDHRAPRKDLKHWSRRLGRAARRLWRSAQEVRLQARLEGVFGQRFVAFSENLILWLILAVLGILVVEVFLPAPETSIGWANVHLYLSWADAAICLVFLIEFFTRLYFVKGKLSWFGRHFLVDLIPSIPYGFIAHHTMDLDKLRAGRAIRLARLPRLLRYVRLARPFVRFFRFFGFLQRGMDRLVRLHGGLLNRNILLFEPKSARKTVADTGELQDLLRRTRNLAREGWRRLSSDMEPAVHSWRIRRFLKGLPGSREILALPLEPATRVPSGGGLLRAEDLIDRLTELDPGTVNAEFGQTSAGRLSATLDRLDVPILRRLPGLKQMIPAARGGEPLERVAAAGKALGRYIERVLARVHWFSDLSGVITGPQFLDRLGSALVQATARPAKRLLIFGLSFLLLKGFVHLLGLTALTGIADWLGRVLGTPFLILGAACLVVLFFGYWFRRVAGEATDFYSRTAEAQYINLLKSAKLVNLDEDMEILWDRVLRPEAVALGEEPGDEAKSLLERFEQGAYAQGQTALEDRVLQLYYDYLDGAIFHITDTKTTSQLLGNLALENIRTERLGMSRKERKRLRALDLDRERTSLRGPYLWFRSITYSVAQWTAKLLLDYNRRAIPAAERKDYPEKVVSQFDAWLARKIEGRRPEPQEEEDEEGRGFVTTEFTALHFLTADEDRDGRVRERFGDKVFEALKADRQAMIRTVFGTHPFHKLPRADRTLNPFEMYGRYLEGGRILLMPLFLIRIVFKILGWFLRRIRITLREILHPDRAEHDLAENWASFGVAVRKINRMRKPIFMECARFRALFDPEYLGLSLGADEESGVEGRTFREDLEGIAARDDEWDPFEDLRNERDSALRELGRRVDEAGGRKAFVHGLRGDSGGGTWRSAYRAVAVAFAIDYRSGAALLTLRERSRKLIADALRCRGKPPGTGLLHRVFWLLLPSRDLKRSLRVFLDRFGPASIDRKKSRWVLRAMRADRDGLGRLVRLGAALEPGTEPEDAGLAVLREVALHPVPWSGQLVTLRTVQSLSVLDVRNYRRQVWALGAYGNE